MQAAGQHVQMHTRAMQTLSTNDMSGSASGMATPGLHSGA